MITTTLLRTPSREVPDAIPAYLLEMYIKEEGTYVYDPSKGYQFLFEWAKSKGYKWKYNAFYHVSTETLTNYPPEFEPESCAVPDSDLKGHLTVLGWSGERRDSALSANPSVSKRGHINVLLWTKGRQLEGQCITCAYAAEEGDVELCRLMGHSQHAVRFKYLDAPKLHKWFVDEEHLESRSGGRA